MPIYKGDTPIVEASGRKGKDGKDGINGENGATYTPSISEEGILSWTNDKDLPNPEPINVKGQDGVSYTLTKSEDGTKIILTGSDGSVQEIIDSNTTYSEATQTESGLMSAADKVKLDNISSGGGDTKLKVIEERTTLYMGNSTKDSTLSSGAYPYYFKLKTSDLSQFDYIEIEPLNNQWVYDNNNIYYQYFIPFTPIKIHTNNQSTFNKSVIVAGYSGENVSSFSFKNNVNVSISTHRNTDEILVGSNSLGKSYLMTATIYGIKLRAVNE